MYGYMAMKTCDSLESLFFSFSKRLSDSDLIENRLTRFKIFVTFVFENALSFYFYFIVYLIC